LPDEKERGEGDREVNKNKPDVAQLALVVDPLYESLDGLKRGAFILCSLQIALPERVQDAVGEPSSGRTLKVSRGTVKPKAPSVIVRVEVNSTDTHSSISVCQRPLSS
jgi:hypothetical protein